MTRQKFAQKFTPEQRKEYQDAQRAEAQERLTQAVSKLQSTKGFREWLTMRGRFHRYSFANTMLIWMQNPDATRVAAASLWREMDRWPMKGSKALRVYAPWEWNVACQKDEQGARWNKDRERWEKKILTFKLVPVFDVSQTEGEALPEPPKPATLRGKSHAHLEQPLTELANSLGYTVSRKKLKAGEHGYCDPHKKQIVIKSGLAVNAQVHTLIHELAHALGIGYEGYGRAMAEVLVESVTYIVCSGAGLAADVMAVPYVAGWAGKANVADALEQFASDVDEIARKIEKVLS